jgi:hypothetical protein
MAAAPQLSLSARGLSSIRYGDALNDFEFIVGDAHYDCPWFVAAFLSHRIANLRSVDNTVCEIQIKTKDPKREFQRFLSLGRGESIKISRDTLEFYESLSEELENEELAFVACGGLEEITIKNVVGRLRHQRRLHFETWKEVEFITSNFTEIHKSELKGLDESIFGLVLSSDKLKIKSEDWLYEMVWSLVEGDRSYFSLLQFVRFEFVLRAIAERFIESAKDFIKVVNLSIWSSLDRRFVQEVRPSTANYRMGGRLIAPRGNSLNGVISYLTTKYGRNVHDKGVITVTASGVCSGYDRRNVVDLQNTSSVFCSDGGSIAWICCELKKEIALWLTHYSILSSRAGPNQTHHPKSWYLEVSQNGQDWREVQRCGENSDLNGPNQIGTYEVKEVRRCRFVRLQRAGLTHTNDNYFYFCGFEIFGILHEPSPASARPFLFKPITRATTP